MHIKQIFKLFSLCAWKSASKSNPHPHPHSLDQLLKSFFTVQALSAKIVKAAREGVSDEIIYNALQIQAKARDSLRMKIVKSGFQKLFDEIERLDPVDLKRLSEDLSNIMKDQQRTPSRKMRDIQRMLAEHIDSSKWSPSFE